MQILTFNDKGRHDPHMKAGDKKPPPPCCPGEGILVGKNVLNKPSVFVTPRNRKQTGFGVTSLRNKSYHQQQVTFNQHQTQQADEPPYYGENKACIHVMLHNTKPHALQAASSRPMTSPPLLLMAMVQASLRGATQSVTIVRRITVSNTPHEIAFGLVCARSRSRYKCCALAVAPKVACVRWENPYAARPATCLRGCLTIGRCFAFFFTHHGHWLPRATFYCE